MDGFSLLIKPASADCNLSCRYCFYLDRAALYPDPGAHRMSDRVLQAVVSKYLATEQPVHAFGWQGGEPALMGSEFFERVTAATDGTGIASCSNRQREARIRAAERELEIAGI